MTWRSLSHLQIFEFFNILGVIGEIKNNKIQQKIKSAETLYTYRKCSYDHSLCRRFFDIANIFGVIGKIKHKITNFGPKLPYFAYNS